MVYFVDYINGMEYDISVEVFNRMLIKGVI